MALPPILLCAFGSTSAEARATYGRIEAAVRARFPDHEIHWAYTSSIVRRALLEEGVPASGPLEALASFKAAGAAAAAVQPLVVSPGQEYEQLLALQIPNLRLVFGRALLESPQDRKRVLDALAEQVRPGVPNVFVAHGNRNKFEYNLAHLEFAQLVRRSFPDAVLASLEGEPGLQPLDSIRLAVARTKTVHFIPLLLVAGEHVQKDLLGDQPSSWKNRVGVPNPTCSPPLGEIPKVVDVFLDHVAEALQAAADGAGG